MILRFAITSILMLAAAIAAASERLPNIIFIMADDLGYGDLSCYGSSDIRTPHIDGLAKDGIRFTDFYATSPICTPARASLLTGCYPRRIGMHEAETGHWVLIPRNTRGLNPTETTMAELLRDKGYATACIGKWHLGDQPPHLPTEHGFDYYYGLPYSNDMANEQRGDPPLPMVEGKVVIDAPVDQSTLTKRYTEKAIHFIESNKDRPFFLYLPHTFPHVPLFASEQFLGKSENGPYGDTVEEIDWSTGQILETLKRLDLDQDTLVIFTSDNGASGHRGSSNKPLSGSKGTTMEGGMRVPMVARWPGKIPAGSVTEALTTHMDMLPTFAAMTSAPMPELPIDGKNILPILLAEEDAESPHEAFYYYRRRQLQAVRSGEWKWHLPLEHTFPKWDTSDFVDENPRLGKLYHLGRDIGETQDVSEDHPEVVKKMTALAERAIKTLGHEDRPGSQQREPLDLEYAVPLVMEEEP